MSRVTPYNHYKLSSQWYIPHPIESVWSTLIRATEYPKWWGAVYDRVEKLNELAGDQVGASALVEAHGRLPYHIRFQSEITDVCAPQLLKLAATGDLTGTGTWRLEEVEDATHVTFTWVVEADKPLLRLLSPLLKPLFAWNHRWTMRRGEMALCKYLDEQQG